MAERGLFSVPYISPGGLNRSRAEATDFSARMSGTHWMKPFPGPAPDNRAGREGDICPKDARGCSAIKSPPHNHLAHCHPQTRCPPPNGTPFPNALSRPECVEYRPVLTWINAYLTKQ